MPKFLIVITGPTGIGKSNLGIILARYYNTEIISADSRQIFKELNIGTAVPSIDELAQVKHHLIQIISITENYSAFKYETEALQIIETLFEKYDIVLMVGGSMLYIDAVCNGIDEMPDADPEIRKNLKNQLEKEGIESLRLQLKNLDPVYYNTVDLKNPNRIIHAIEICLTTGSPYSSFRSNSTKNRSFSIIKIGLNCDRQILHNQINTRVDKMITAGLENEARLLYKFRNLNSMNTVGYQELFASFDGQISRDNAIELIKRNSRRYARKQLTWFRRDEKMKWFEPQQESEIISHIEKLTSTL